MKILSLFFGLLGLILSSCGGNHSKSDALSNSDTTINSLVSMRQDTFTGPIDTTAVEIDTNYIPKFIGNSTNPCYILLDGGAYHSEITYDAGKLNWMGLFKSKDGYYTSQTKIKCEHAYDPILDSRDTIKKTGWQITTFHKDTTILLISGIDYMPQHKVDNLIKPQNFPHPEDDTLRFNFKGTRYKLYASGLRRNDKNDLKYYVYWNYKLYLTGTKNGIEITQILRAYPHLEYDNIVFIGDLDGDDVPDMIFNLSGEDYSAHTLYLSMPAKSDELLQVVAQWTTVGC